MKKGQRNMGTFKKGHKSFWTEETGRKYSANHPRYWLGKHHSEETKKRLSEIGKTKTGKYHSRWKGGLNKVSVRRARLSGAMGIHTNQEWEELKSKFNFMCLCCKQQEPFVKLTEDHIIPLSRGGSNLINNIQPLCQSCNSRKYIAAINYINNTTLLV